MTGIQHAGTDIIAARRLLGCRKEQGFLKQLRQLLQVYNIKAPSVTVEYTDLTVSCFSCNNGPLSTTPVGWLIAHNRHQLHPPACLYYLYTINSQHH